MHRQLNVLTPDGPCPTSLYLPDGAGPWPGVIMLMDGPGIRPAIGAMADRLAASGFAVFLPDLFHRAGRYAPIDPRIVFADPALRERHRTTLMASATPASAMTDVGALIAEMERNPDVAQGPYGVVGYCMGGRLALFAAGTFPDRFAAAASYHGGGLATDVPSSPHLLAPRIKGEVYVAGAIDDANFDDDQKQRLEQALGDAGVRHQIETYPARHGWVPSDMPAHDEQEAEHHWQTLVPFMKRLLAGDGTDAARG